MTQDMNTNRAIVLAARPQGAPTPANFRLERSPRPEPGDGQVLLRTVFLSLDPYMRGRMSDAPSYAPPVAIGATMVGGTVSRVVASHKAEYRVGDWVVGMSGWQDFALSDGTGIRNLGADLPHPALALGLLGMPGFTAYMGLTDIGRPEAGETLVVAAATGAVGSVVGQIAKRRGAFVVGIAGGPEKCRWAVDELGFDACLDHREPDLGGRLAAACPDGIDVYFENVGGAVFEAVLPLFNTHARVPMCGVVSQYNATTLPSEPDHLPQLLAALVKKRIRMQGFIIFDDYGNRFGEFYEQMSRWHAEGQIKFREDIVDGLEKAPEAFIGLLEGRNFGKLVVRVGLD